MGRLEICVFSRDRAFQLEAALRSFRMHARDADGVTCVVLYRATNEQHARQYARLADDHAHIRFVSERDFRNDLLALTSSFELVMFMVDDSMFTRSFSLRSVADTLLRETRALGFSLRLGSNTTYCYTLDRPQAPPAFRTVTRETLEYDWSGAEYDFGYPLELSSSIYRLPDLYPFIEALAFDGPNTLESEMAGRAQEFASRRPSLLCFERSVAFSAPLNVVQQAFPNRSRGGVDCSAGALSDLFERGLRLDVEAWRDHTPRAAHEEIELRLAPR